MSLPKALNFGLARFDKTTKEIIRIQSDKTSYANGEVAVYRFPSNGVIDIESLSVFANVAFTAGAAAASGAVSLELGKLMRRMELLINGQVVFGDSCTDFGLAYAIKKRLANPDYSAATATQSRLYDIASGTTSATQGTVVNVPALLMDMPHLFKNMRYIPLAALGTVELRVTWEFPSRINSALPASQTVSVGNTHLLVSRVNFAENMLDQMVASRLAQAPLEIASENWYNFQGTSYGNGSASTPFSINAQSIDYIAMFHRPAAPTAGSAFFDTRSGGAASTHQLLVGGVPQSSTPLSLPEVYYATVADGLDGAGNVLISPQVGTTITEWQDNRFMYLHRLKFLGADKHEDDRLVSGLSSYGQNVPMIYQSQITDSAQVPNIVAFCTRTMELSGGRMLRVIQ